MKAEGSRRISDRLFALGGGWRNDLGLRSRKNVGYPSRNRRPKTRPAGTGRRSTPSPSQSSRGGARRMGARVFRTQDLLRSRVGSAATREEMQREGGSPATPFRSIRWRFAHPQHSRPLPRTWTQPKRPPEATGNVARNPDPLTAAISSPERHELASRALRSATALELNPQLFTQAAVYLAMGSFRTILDGHNRRALHARGRLNQAV